MLTCNRGRNLGDFRLNIRVFSCDFLHPHSHFPIVVDIPTYPAYRNICGLKSTDGTPINHSHTSWLTFFVAETPFRPFLVKDFTEVLPSFIFRKLSWPGKSVELPIYFLMMSDICLVPINQGSNKQFCQAYNPNHAGQPRKFMRGMRMFLLKQILSKGFKGCESTKHHR